MAHSNERIEFLRESRQHYKQEIPPFTQRGNVSYKKDVMLLPPYVDRPRKTTVVYIRYKLQGGDRTFACLRMNRRRFIVKAMKRNWEAGDPIDNTGGSCYWYQWQGPDAAEKFIGPVAVSMARYLTNNPGANHGIQDPPSDSEDARSRQFGKAHGGSTKSSSNRDGGMVRQDSDSAFLFNASSSETSADRDLPRRRTQTDEYPPASDLSHPTTKASKSRMQTGPKRKSVPSSTTIPQKRQTLPRRSTRVLSPAQEQSTILHIERLEDGVTPVRMKLSSAAVPRDDPGKRVTHASFFDLVTKIVNPISQPDLIQAAIYPPLSRLNNNEASDIQPNVRYDISISYQLEETFEDFLNKVKAYFEEHHLKVGDSNLFECHVAIKSTVIVP